ncbi:hypothetical protein [Gordonia terrae]|uniref:Type II CBASS E2 protein domain-containing protein n=2 Tax=Gordonia terrae TaxID=2055 RepID=A0AAD0K7K4_9ACTN|nr:hypothetical protein [Gordonia terrae]VTR07671.1 Uncharacterised protein [Clostridioides difficile]ANY23881.1 hypothetical protein BCM27_14755 [Gordonia terrae]AWO84614.1 hypothetical protein DLJ61_14895 [Gordonia terrae]VTS55530.1 Uncharacterised protein [Gordonia terrae]GAB42104.1 hypothetical protein GOTRE_007_00530 [Gordonia terrae NBRC 100016]
MARPRGKQLTVIQQAVGLQQRFPEERRPLVKAGLLIWSVTLQPTPMSVLYKVGIRYVHRRRPNVTVLTPTLETRPHEPLPHVYPGNELCLYYGNEFDGSKHFIATTIVPWASEWLYFYEHWISTGQWLGSEAPHPPGFEKG